MKTEIYETPAIQITGLFAEQSFLAGSGGLDFGGPNEAGGDVLDDNWGDY